MKDRVSFEFIPQKIPKPCIEKNMAPEQNFQRIILACYMKHSDVQWHNGIGPLTCPPFKKMVIWLSSS